MAPSFLHLLTLTLTLLLISPTTTAIDENQLKVPNLPNFNPNPTANLNGSAIDASLPKLPYPIQKGSTQVVILENSTLSSPNQTFALGFFSTNGGDLDSPSWYLGIWYALIPVPTCVWVANRVRPIKNLTGSSLEITRTGRLTVKGSDGVVWSSSNSELGVDVELLENGNLVLLTPGGTVAWQSFDFPTDTWLPGMNMTSDRGLTSWRSYRDPSPGLYSLRLRPPEFGEFELIFNGSVVYWRTGNWTGFGFTNVPEMLVPYIYRFHFIDPFKPTASFGFTERPLDSGLDPPLTRFQVGFSGQLRQFTWAKQTWDMFWSQPDSKCRVFGLCGAFGVCNGDQTVRQCECLSGFVPVDQPGWNYGDYSGGCRRVDENVDCNKRDDGFAKVGAGRYEGTVVRSLRTYWDLCQTTCLDACYCVGVSFDETSISTIGGDNSTGMCKVYFGSLLSLRNLSSESDSAGGGADVVYVRVQKSAKLKVNKSVSPVVLTAGIVGAVGGLILVLVVAVVVLLWRKQKEKEKKEEAAQFLAACNLKVFSYKELQAATRNWDFKEKVGHGGFGAVFRGELSDSTIVAVKRLDRPGGGEQEFQNEVQTIGKLQHVNLVRLRGFCSEDSHRLLVYDYMPNGALSEYLHGNGPNLSWDIRYRVAVGMARGIAYLHHGCTDCVIHCDIKPENVLLDSDFTATVSDFGLAKLLCRDYSRVQATMRGTWGYMAPEWLSAGEITAKADVYSYGMTLIELLRGLRNKEPRGAVGGREGGSETADSWFFPPWAAQQIVEGKVRAVLDDRLGCTSNMQEVNRVALVAVWCIQDAESMRPTMKDVVEMLEGVQPVTGPPAPELLKALVAGESFRSVKADSGIGSSNGSGFSGYNTKLSSRGSKSSIGNTSSVVN